MKFIIAINFFVLPFFALSQKTESTDTSLQVFTKVDVEASVDKKSWQTHLQNVLVAVIEKAVGMKGIKVGQYTVRVRFLIEVDGRISDVEAINDPGFGFAQGAVMAVKTGPKWIPGQMSDGHKVRSYHTQPITFVISNK